MSRLVRAGLTVLCLCVGVIDAQSTIDSEFVQDGERLLALSTSNLNSASDQSSFVFSFEHQGSLKRFVAKSDTSSAQSNWYPTNSQDTWVAFSTAKSRFVELQNQLKIKVEHAEWFDSVAEKYPNIRLKHYKDLGYTLIEVPEYEDPVSFSAYLKGERAVTEVQLVLKHPLYLPQ